MENGKQKKGWFKRYLERLEKAQKCSAHDRGRRYSRMNGTRRRA